MFNESAESWRFVFVFGCGHSATTLVASMLGAHSRCQLYSEETQIFQKGNPKAAENLLRFGLRLVQDQGYDFLVEKTPRHVNYVDAIVQAFPQAGLIALVRYPRDVVASMLRSRGVTFETALGRWLHDNSALTAAQQTHNIHLLRYEDLIAEPEGACRGLCDYLGIAYEPAMLAFHEHAPDFYDRTMRADPEGHEAQRNRQIHQPLTDRRGVYRDYLTAEQIAEIEGRVSEMMQVFGYTP